MTLCQMCKQREATLTATIEVIGRRNLCTTCHTAIPPKKRRTHIAWHPKDRAAWKNANHSRHYGRFSESFNKLISREVRSLRRDYP